MINPPSKPNVITFFIPVRLTLTGSKTYLPNKRRGLPF
jgi:hypothetical protein